MQTVDDQLIILQDGRNYHHMHDSNAQVAWSSAADDEYDEQYYHQDRHQDHYHEQDHHHHYQTPQHSYQLQNSEIGEQVDTEEDNVHVNEDDLYGYSTVVINASINCTLNQLGKNGNMAVWKPSDQMLNKLFKNNRRSTNISNATGKDLNGDLTKVIILNAKLTNGGNHFDTPIGFKCTGMNPKHITETDSYSYVLEPRVPLDPANKSIFSPENKFTRTMYSNYGKLNMKALKQQIRFSENGNSDIDVRGIAWANVMANIDHIPKWGSAADHIYKLDHESRNDGLMSPWVRIPTLIAKHVYDNLAEEIKTAEKSLVNMKDFRVTFYRADGADSWDDVRGLIGQEIGADADAQTNYKNFAINKVCRAYAKIELSFITYEDESEQ